MKHDSTHDQGKPLNPPVKQRWSKPTGGDQNIADGNAEYQCGKQQQRYGTAHSETNSAGKTSQKPQPHH
jgi:uncharacterized protein YjbJ (UPF0337 family)